MSNKFNRDSVSRARLFIEMARQCSAEDRDQHEAFLDAAIVFARSSLQRLRSAYRKRSGWKPWWDALAADASVVFLKHQRNFMLHEGPAPVGQVVYAGGGHPLALDHYYFEHHTVPAVDTLTRHMDRIEEI